MEAFGVLLTFFIVVGFFYFVPTIVAYNRNHSNKEAIMACNFIFGWTFIGWGVAFVWAHTE